MYRRGSLRGGDAGSRADLEPAQYFRRLAGGERSQGSPEAPVRKHTGGRGPAPGPAPPNRRSGTGSAGGLGRVLIVPHSAQGTAGSPHVPVGLCAALPPRGRPVETPFTPTVHTRGRPVEAPFTPAVHTRPGAPAGGPARAVPPAVAGTCADEGGAGNIAMGLGGGGRRAKTVTVGLGGALEAGHEARIILFLAQQVGLAKRLRESRPSGVRWTGEEGERGASLNRGLPRKAPAVARRGGGGVTRPAVKQV